MVVNRVPSSGPNVGLDFTFPSLTLRIMMGHSIWNNCPVSLLLILHCLVLICKTLLFDFPNQACLFVIVVVLAVVGVVCNLKNAKTFLTLCAISVCSYVTGQRRDKRLSLIMRSSYYWCCCFRCCSRCPSYRPEHAIKVTLRRLCLSLFMFKKTIKMTQFYPACSHVELF